MQTRTTPIKDNFYAVGIYFYFCKSFKNFHREKALSNKVQTHMHFFFNLGFLLRTFTNNRTASEGGGHFLNSSIPLPPASQTLRHQPGYYCRELTSALSQQPDVSREALVSERKSLTTKLSFCMNMNKYKNEHWGS